MTKDLLPIEAIVEKLNLPEKYVERLGRYGAKLTLDLLDDPTFPVRGKFILVTATTPTLSGEGKTVTSIGLVQGLEKIGKKAIITSREPSLGPVFGMKGGAAGGGRSQVEPAEKINLHFHGDFHAITSAHNLLAALIDSHLFHGNPLELDPDAVTWPRTLDMNDRALRHIIVQAGGKRDGANRHTGFLITAASEIMAIMTLATSREDLRTRLGRIVIGATRAGKPVLAEDLKATGPMMALLNEAILPNLVQTTEGTPALVHCGPFANIAHGTSSVLSQQMGLRLADYVVNETGFASDLGFEKYMDIVMPSSGIKPSAAVLVTTVQSVRNQGAGDLEAGFENLKKHIAIVRGFNLPAIVAINRFPNDTEEELKFLEKYCEAQGAAFALSEAFAKGGAGATALAEKVVSVIDANPNVVPTSTYAPGASALEKIIAVAQKVYGAANVKLTPQAEEKLARFTRWGYGALPVCIAKTQYSLTDDPKLMGAPTGWTLHISDVVLSAGAGFLVVISGSMMLMPGLPKSSRAMDINVNAAGEITGMS
ncbi:formate--tetrahydrofolate ligase [Tunturiibacter gelidoferens]|uniref:Formate--tetrahydrofolate ligase n=1 Tax=Tunturiibacter lichenicola TaxID=2051959 RepID=A0A7Y9NR23_9BACT|nr:formate--tetrahydrofolate ligase [Edaphobacter lichenicola]NYF53747.1 formate--tetrahydrofolate ligase [Edaphobacter lichenicola]